MTTLINIDIIKTECPNSFTKTGATPQKAPFAIPTAKHPPTAKGDVLISFLRLSDVSVTAIGALAADKDTGKIARQISIATRENKTNPFGSDKVSMNCPAVTAARSTIRYNDKTWPRLSLGACSLIQLSINR